MSHIIGYTGRVADEDLAGRDDPVLQLPTMRFGKKGVETLARGRSARPRRRQSRSRSMRSAAWCASSTAPRASPAPTSLLTIDLDLQEFADASACRRASRAARCVVIDVVTGDVLAMVSTPGFDPNTFARGITQPNGATCSTIRSAAQQQGDQRRLSAGLDLQDGDRAGGARIQGDRSAGPRAACPGYHRARRHQVPLLAEGRPRRTQRQRGDRPVVRLLLLRGRAPGRHRSHRRDGRPLGSAGRVELGLPGESAGNQPDARLEAGETRQALAAWRHLQPRHRPGLHDCDAAAARHHDGAHRQRRLRGAAQPAAGQATPREELAPPPPRDKPRAPSLPIDPQHLAIVRQGMPTWSMPASARPTSCASTPRASRSSPPSFAGKTGTAQVKRITDRERDMGITQAQLPWHLRHHALFVCFGPVEQSALRLRRDRRARPWRAAPTARPDRPRRAGRDHEARSVAPYRPLPQDGVADERRR